MARLVVEYDVCPGDAVRFGMPGDGTVHEGVVQDISQLPDVFVEGWDADGRCTRWRVGVDTLDFTPCVRWDAGRSCRTVFREDEPVEFVHGEDGGLLWRRAGGKVFSETGDTGRGAE